MGPVSRRSLLEGVIPKTARSLQRGEGSGVERTRADFQAITLTVTVSTAQRCDV